MTFRDYMKQPTTIHGIAAIVGLLAGYAASVLAGDMTLAGGAGGLVYGLVHVILPDNSAAPTSIEKAFTDTVEAVVKNNVQQQMPQLMADAFSALASISAPKTGA